LHSKYSEILAIYNVVFKQMQSEYMVTVMSTQFNNKTKQK